MGGLSVLVYTVYHIFHCENDGSVNIDKHSRPFVEKMKAEHDVTFYSIPDRGHCDPGEAYDRIFDELLIKGATKTVSNIDIQDDILYNQTNNIFVRLL